MESLEDGRVATAMRSDASSIDKGENRHAPATRWINITLRAIESCVAGLERQPDPMIPRISICYPKQDAPVWVSYGRHVAEVVCLKCSKCVSGVGR
jgi:hypothetical protein